MRGGLDGGPGVLDGWWWVVRIAVEGFDGFLGVVSRSSGALEDKFDQVDAVVPVELFLFFAFGHVAWTTAGGGYEPSTGGERCNSRRVNVIRAASKVKDNIHACPFRLSTRLGQA